jgi:N-acetylneuraminic acid mutarotase
MARIFCVGIVCLLAIGIMTTPGSVSASSEAQRETPARALTFVERIGFQRAIEEVYWRHRIWPKGNAGPKPPLDAAISQRQIEKKVEEYLRKSHFVTQQRGFPISAGELQQEMNRMAAQTKEPEMLRELFATLANDPFVIAECLARPALVERLPADIIRVAGMPFAARNFSTADTAASTENGIRMTSFSDNGQYKLPEIPLLSCTDDTWTAISATDAPDGRIDYTAVWTGSEMIVWGGFNFSPPYFLSSGGRYNPATDTWSSTDITKAPNARDFHTAVWTGTEMIVWGGYTNGDDLNTGGRYNPAADMWTATATINAPIGRESHTAVWTGTEMIVWGGVGCGSNCLLNTGGRYNPATDSWTATTIANAPRNRFTHTTVWTGTEMVVWGGSDRTNYLHTGGRYDPSTDRWTATNTANAPLGRIAHTAVWTGKEMMVWGGVDSTFNDCNTGGKYNPTGDNWATMSAVNAPSARDSHTAVWTGSEMIIWAGVFCCPAIDFDTGARYNPNTDSWTATSTTNPPLARWAHTAVWTGSEMIVWGGYNDDAGVFLNTGGKYCAPPAVTPTPSVTATPTATPSATATATPRIAPTPRARPTPRPRP